MAWTERVKCRKYGAKATVPEQDRVKIAVQQKPFEEVVYNRMLRLSYENGRNYCRISYASVQESTSLRSKNAVITGIQGLIEKRHIVKLMNDEGKPDMNREGTLYRVLSPQEIINGVLEDGDVVVELNRDGMKFEMSEKILHADINEKANGLSSRKKKKQGYTSLGYKDHKEEKPRKSVFPVAAAFTVGILFALFAFMTIYQISSAFWKNPQEKQWNLKDGQSGIEDQNERTLLQEDGNTEENSMAGKKDNHDNCEEIDDRNQSEVEDSEDEEQDFSDNEEDLDDIDSERVAAMDMGGQRSTTEKKVKKDTEKIEKSRKIRSERIIKKTNKSRKAAEKRASVAKNKQTDGKKTQEVDKSGRKQEITGKNAKAVNKNENSAAKSNSADKNSDKTKEKMENKNDNKDTEEVIFQERPGSIIE